MVLGENGSVPQIKILNGLCGQRGDPYSNNHSQIKILNRLHGQRGDPYSKVPHMKILDRLHGQREDPYNNTPVKILICGTTNLNRLHGKVCADLRR